VAFAAFSWVPLHARHVVAAGGFTDFAARPRRPRRPRRFLQVFGRLLSQGVADDLDRVLAELSRRDPERPWLVAEGACLIGAG
jgi:hypothetical protein